MITFNWVSHRQVTNGHGAALSWHHAVEDILYVSQKKCLLSIQEDRVVTVSCKNTTWADEFVSLKKTAGKN